LGKVKTPTVNEDQPKEKKREGERTSEWTTLRRTRKEELN